MNCLLEDTASQFLNFTQEDGGTASNLCITQEISPSAELDILNLVHVIAITIAVF